MLGDAAEPTSRAPMARPIAAGRGWAINDVVCRLEPQDRPYWKNRRPRHGGSRRRWTIRTEIVLP